MISKFLSYRLEKIHKRFATKIKLSKTTNHVSKDTIYMVSVGKNGKRFATKISSKSKYYK